ncbi:system b protein [Rutstroemia sp. NJR-2017a WRK4]|nr:system b protein [Rutstroemia sp. NJR-2017a WRK4]
MFRNAPDSYYSAAASATTPDGAPRKIPPPTPLTFPSSTPQAPERVPLGETPLVTFIQTIHRPTDIRISHFEALGIHVIPNASPQDLLPDASYLPPVEEWTAIPQDGLEAANAASKRPLNNGNKSPGVQTYLERRKELSIDNTAAFRTIRRIPAAPGTHAPRLGNAYEFYKNLEVFSSYWVDTSLPKEANSSPEATENGNAEGSKQDTTPIHEKTHIRTGTGSQTPAEYRQGLLASFVKLVAYDFGCNVAFPRVEPRLHLHPPSPSSPASHIPATLTMIYRTPTDRNSARAGIVEGPLAALSCRSTTSFTTPLDSNLDLAREIVALLLTAQQRNREGKAEKPFGDGKWWTSVPRWGGGKGGPIGKEIESSPTPTAPPPTTADLVSDIKARIEGFGSGLGSGDNKRPPQKKARTSRPGGTMQIYDNYRKMLPPSSTWDRKARYMAIGKVGGAQGEWDDVFLVSCINHHIGFLRARVGKGLLDELEDGGKGRQALDRTTVWRSKWYDVFLAEERIEAMNVVWGIMAWSMRDTLNDGAAERMDVDR